VALSRGLPVVAVAKSDLGRLLKWAGLALQFERLDDAATLLSRANLDAQLDTRDLGYSNKGAIDERFRYWRLRHRLLRRQTPDLANEVLVSVPPDESTPAGNRIMPSASAHDYPEAIELMRVVDAIVR
jgi:hypothetical protein